jgi:hypothetical protein
MKLKLNLKLESKAKLNLFPMRHSSLRNNERVVPTRGEGRVEAQGRGAHLGRREKEKEKEG